MSVQARQQVFFPVSIIASDRVVPNGSPAIQTLGNYIETFPKFLLEHSGPAHVFRISPRAVRIVAPGVRIAVAKYCLHFMHLANIFMVSLNQKRNVGYANDE